MQEQQEPVPIHIRIDRQEQRSGIPDLLASMPQGHVEVIPLRMGDYDVGGDPCRIFERKTGSDFLWSLALPDASGKHSRGTRLHRRHFTRADLIQ